MVLVIPLPDITTEVLRVFGVVLACAVTLNEPLPPPESGVTEIKSLFISLFCFSY
nr:MAG TPA: hypothetical protein [Herelleviridae sp.]